MSEQSTQQPTEITEAQRAEWVRAQFQKANEYLATKGIIPDNVAVSESRYLPPLVAVWKLNTRDAKSFWVISGDLPTDHMPVTAAPNAREAIRAFALHWQLKAEQIAQAGFTDKTQVDFANLLVNRAEGLYNLFDNEPLWQGQ
ncbi:DUF4826 family protein [Alishewanella jeotgali]|jgi:hypothetical protein|uniref:DUF4826 domain-containing protein n=1 Tax=Alishewanella jeotgali KCTC 22429 TaxID=1129374 RepID=H3ZAP9_9ALTE|nr:DUF4826 family protein [Alishewanella jeotgali]EHR42013.1 hypothetical protein AJE_02011 [Alishewanella jeotgali KCTC 22429]